MTTLYPIHTQTLLSKGHNLRRDTEILTAETHKLEALGVVLRKWSQEFSFAPTTSRVHPHPGRGETILSIRSKRGSVLIVIEDMSVALRNRFLYPYS